MRLHLKDLPLTSSVMDPQGHFPGRGAQLPLLGLLPNTGHSRTLYQTSHRRRCPIDRKIGQAFHRRSCCALPGPADEPGVAITALIDLPGIHDCSQAARRSRLCSASCWRPHPDLAIRVVNASRVNRNCGLALELAGQRPASADRPWT